MRVSKSSLRRLVAVHCPEFHLCSDDSYWPCSIEYFLSKSRLVKCRAKGQTVVLKEVGSLNSEDELLNLSRLHAEEDPTTRLCLEPCVRSGEEILDEVPVYAVAKAICVEDSSEELSSCEALEITYITLFPFNGHYTLVPHLLKVGSHYGDIEHITVRINPVTEELLGVWYNAHRNHDGQWVQADKVERSSESGRILSYIAKHGHGHYPTEGMVHRHFYLANDKCEKGPLWRPRKVVLAPSVLEDENSVHLNRCPSRGSSLSAMGCSPGTVSIIPHVDDTRSSSWMYFNGYLGTAPAPCLQRWFSNAEPPITRHYFWRVFFHFWPETSCL